MSTSQCAALGLAALLARACVRDDSSPLLQFAVGGHARTRAHARPADRKPALAVGALQDAVAQAQGAGARP